MSGAIVMGTLRLSGWVTGTCWLGGLQMKNWAAGRLLELTSCCPCGTTPPCETTGDICSAGHDVTFGAMIFLPVELIQVKCSSETKCSLYFFPVDSDVNTSTLCAVQRH